MVKNITEEQLVVQNQECPMCSQKKAVFGEYEIDDSYCGKIAVFSINCKACGFKKNDLEFLEPKAPAVYTLDISSKEDLNTRIIKSGECEIEIKKLKISVDSSYNSEGFVTNIEGVLNRFKDQIELLSDDMSIDKDKRKKANKILKEIEEVKNGTKKISIELFDPSGNSAIISDKVKIVKKRGAKK